MLAALVAFALGAAQPAETPVAAVAPAPAAAPVETARERRRREQAAAPRNAVECREVTPTGSNVPKTACFTRAEWERIRQDSMADYRTLNDASRDGMLRGR